ncbi:MAG TPA: biotin--[acetyl-CoA-carboxylase] ligase [Chitinophagaceae bacterium]|nr:biotin--[acetyl-CoA-carboxylase] ligase [Chitinophagaceae bacterium]
MPLTDPLRHRFIELLTVDSTNNYAMGLVHEGMAQHGTVVFANEQTNGKGQREKRWYSAPAENIMISIVLNPSPLTISQQFYLSMATALAVQKWFGSVCGDEAKIKWPNDLYWCDRKAGGILIENVLYGSEWRYAIAGIGININQTDFGLLQQSAVSLKQITGRHFDTRELTEKLLRELELRYQLLEKDTMSVLRDFNSILYKRGERIKFRKGARVFESVVKEVTSAGNLITQHEIEEEFAPGSVEWLVK